MTDLNNSSNDGDARHAGAQGEPHADDWQRFLDDHADDLGDVARSRTAKKFDRHAKREEKKTVLTVDDLSAEAFTNAGRGPRDYRSSWLDTDDVLDRDGSGFRAPNPSLRGIRTSKLICAAILALGVAAIIVAACCPRIVGVIGLLGALCVLIGAGGLIAQHEGRDVIHDDDSDNGARV